MLIMLAVLRSTLEAERLAYHANDDVAAWQLRIWLTNSKSFRSASLREIVQRGDHSRPKTRPSRGHNLRFRRPKCSFDFLDPTGDVDDCQRESRVFRLRGRMQRKSHTTPGYNPSM